MTHHHAQLSRVVNRRFPSFGLFRSGIRTLALVTAVIVFQLKLKFWRRANKQPQILVDREATLVCKSPRRRRKNKKKKKKNRTSIRIKCNKIKNNTCKRRRHRNISGVVFSGKPAPKTEKRRMFFFLPDLLRSLWLRDAVTHHTVSQSFHRNDKVIGHLPEDWEEVGYSSQPVTLRRFELQQPSRKTF